MPLIRIKEYIDTNKKTIEKPIDITKQVLKSPPNSPEKNKTSGKNYGFSAAMDAKPLDYQAKKIVVAQKKDDEWGLGSFGTPGIDYEKTRKNIVDFSELKEHCGCEKKVAPFVVAYSSGSFHPDPIQAIKYIVYLTNENDNLLKALMQEAKSRGCLHKYMKHLVKYPEMQKYMVQKS
jgi:hypothetical protein